MNQSVRDELGKTAGETSSTDGVTELLSAVRGGEEQAFEELLGRVYAELKGLAERHLRRERGDHTLQPTALVHEAYLRLFQERERRWENRAHFLRVAAMAMRRILVNYSIRRATEKRGGERVRTELDDTLEVFCDRAIDLIELNEAIDALTAIDERKGRTVELRFFAGLTVPEVAKVLDVSERTVERDWDFARVWLRRRMSDG